MARIVISEQFEGSRITRADGAKLRRIIDEHWNEAELLILDFSGLRIASASFFDESLGVLARKVPLDELTRRVRVENIDPADRRLLNQIVLSGAEEAGASHNATDKNEDHQPSSEDVLGTPR
jgi:hypothetical protein